MLRFSLPGMPTSSEPPRYQWSAVDLQYAESELEKEYANINTSIIGIVVALAKTVVPPSEGKVKLLEVARKNLRR
ncbi:MAG: hypothetical protein JWO89_3674 [Verrucomicrobiaceae bacterium]|nr:hypothetical protein [Verrucomicrobiaceae bacterium]